MNSKEAFERIEQCCVSACLGLGQSPYNRFLQSYTPCKEDLEVVKKDLNRLEKLEKAIKILKEVVSLNSNRILETERQFLRLSKEEYELLKEVLYNE